MSLASDYAASVAASQASMGAPAPFVGANWRAEVTSTGNLRLTSTVSGIFESPGTSVPAFTAWLTANFG